MDMNCSNASGCAGGNHFWAWSGTYPGWPYDGMRCTCGLAQYDKVETLTREIKRLEEELAQAIEGRRS